jgi:hypothetical protein
MKKLILLTDEQREFLKLEIKYNQGHYFPEDDGYKTCEEILKALDRDVKKELILKMDVKIQQDWLIALDIPPMAQKNRGLNLGIRNCQEIINDFVKEEK